ncbi:hypothetical protein Micbo1qcDRAFT_203907 [Microdochium bolleyi]|uniref:Uncharacterized protein n=1 Tax=Microdochium bolleyi TaxID=196109 RepID=A0A136J3T1_9PEZI|nr:hypothetical protein Micbo1qcDRAFT_203907 [Microdochium bolleyi]
MHASIAVALAYDRHLNPNPSRRRSELLAEECFHGSRSIALFNEVLQHPIKAQHKDAVWGTAAFLAILAFSAPAGTWLTSEESWPLKTSTPSSSSPSSSLSPSSAASWSSDISRVFPTPSADQSYQPPDVSHQSASRNSPGTEPDDLQWLLVKEGKMSLWAITDPLREDSIFHVMMPVYATMFSPLPKSGIQGIHPALAALYELDSDSNNDGSPYFLPLHALSRLLNLRSENSTNGNSGSGQISIGHTEPFMNLIQGAFRALLVAREPRALLLLYLWYRRAGKVVWWIDLRARVEGPAICEYLRRCCGHGPSRRVLDFLPGGCFADERSLRASFWTSES